MLMLSCVCSSNRTYEEISLKPTTQSMSMEQFAVRHAESRGYRHTDVRLVSRCHIYYLLFTFLPPSFSNYVVSSWHSESLVDVLSICR